MLYYPPLFQLLANKAFFGKPLLVALTKTFLQVICSHPHKDLEAQKVHYYPSPSRRQLFELLANKAFLESPDQ